MILTCPECATSYFVDDDRIPAAGRTVKCSSCGARWKAMPEGEAEPEFEPAPASVEVPAEVEAEEPVLAASDDLEFVPSPATRRPGKKAKVKKEGSRAPVVGVVLIGVIAALAGGLVVMRERVAAMVPKTAKAFAMVGLPVNELGLSFEAVTWRPTFLAGRPVMSMTGSIRNSRDHAINSPPIRISVLDGKKKALAVYELEMTNQRVPPGSVRYFAWNLPDPPRGAEHISIAFNPHGEILTHATEAHGEGGHAAAPAPAEAQPLPADSPDALPKHDEH